MKLKKYSELFTGCFFLIIAIIYANQIPKIKITKISLINSAFFPKILFVALTALALLQIYKGVISIKKAKEGSGQEKVEIIDNNCVFMTFGLSLCYVIILEPLGFLISSIIYMFCQMMVLSPRKEQKPVMFIIISIIASFVVYYLFRNGLSLMLPAGILTGIL